MATETKGHTPEPCKARHKVGAGWEILVPCGEQDFVEGVTKNEYPMFVEAFVQFPTPDWAQQVEAYAQLFAAAPETAAERDRLLVVNAELLAALQDLLKLSGTIEVLGEWEALDINDNLRSKERQRVNEAIQRAMAAITNAEEG